MLSAKKNNTHSVGTRVIDITLDQFVPRDYQVDFIRAFEERKINKFILVWPRRAGKDLIAFQLLLREALKRKGSYYIIYPTYSQARKILFQSVTSGKEVEAKRYTEFIPKELIRSFNKQEMKFELYNDSVIQAVGSEKVGSLVGISIQGAIFSERSRQREDVYRYLEPAIEESGGFALFISTPYGRNHFYDLYNVAKKSDEWYTQRYTIEDTKHISVETIEKRIANGEYTRDHALQEYWCSFSAGAEGTLYGKYLDTMRHDGHIGDVPFDPSYKVHVSIDIGLRDPTSIIFFQKIQDSYRIIRSYENTNESLEFYISYIHKLKDSHGYIYGKFIAPRDMKVREYTSGVSRIEKASRLGVPFTLVPKGVGLWDGINAVRTLLPRVRIDEIHAEGLIVALENYRKEWDDRKSMYKEEPLHDKYSHYADAMRYMAISTRYLEDNSTAEELEELFLKSKYGVTQRNDFFESFNKRK